MKPKNKASKPRKNSVKKKKPEEDSLTFDTEMQQFFLSGEHVTPRIIEYFADNMVKYINNHEDVLHIYEYGLRKGVDYDKYNDWCQKHQYLKKRHDFCRQLLGLRREKKMAGYDPKTLHHTLHMYSREWDKANKDKAALRKVEDEGKTQPIKIVFDDYRDKK